jgi:hypothetical protein
MIGEIIVTLLSGWIATYKLHCVVACVEFAFATRENIGIVSSMPADTDAAMKERRVSATVLAVCLMQLSPRGN